MSEKLQKYISIKGAKENNLKNISLEIPRNKITAVVGVSGSGKSSLIIDILQKESMRQLFDTMGGLNQVKKPLVDSIEGLSPVIHIDQHITNRNPRSTVGTATDILKFIRLLFAQVGVRECSHCGNKIPPLISEYENDFDCSDDLNSTSEILRDKCPACGHEIRKYRMSDFSYNNPNGACPKCHGIGQIYSVNRSVAIDEELSVYDGAFKSWGKNEIKVYIPIVLAAGKYYGFEFDPNEKVKNISPEAKAFLYYGNDDRRFTKYYPNLERPNEKKYLFVGFINDMEITYEKSLDNEGWTERFGRFMTQVECPECVICMSGKPISKGARSNIATYTDIYTHIRKLFEKQPKAKLLGLDKKDFSFNVRGGRCEHYEGQGTVELNMVLMPTMEVQCPVCKGKRFNKNVLEVKYKDKSITDILNTTCDNALPLFRDVPGIYRVLKAMSDIGLGYLTIGHQLNQLSGGECQRIRLVRELSQNKKGKNLYVFDEPTTGLHPRDIEKLVLIMKGLKRNGHTLVVIEHNLDPMLEADHIIDLGTGGGADGGKVIYQGSVGGLLMKTESRTGSCIKEYISQNR